MGLFSKKPKPRKPDAAPAPATADERPAPAAATAPARDSKPEKMPEKMKVKKGTVDPVDFLALRSELVELRSRLDASEQAKAIVEARLAALDATTTAMATERPAAVENELNGKIAELEAQLAEVAAAAAAASEAANGAAAARSDDPAPPTVAEPDPELAQRIDQLAQRLEQVADTSRVEAIEAQLGDLAARASEPMIAPAPPPIVDPDTAERLDQLGERVAAIDSLSTQLAQLNARVAAQAEFGSQLSSLRDRIDEINDDTDARRAAAVAATSDADLRDRVNALADRLAHTEGFGDQIAQLAERVAATDGSARQTGEQVAAIEQRLNSVTTELANQVSELGRDIDGLAARTADVADGAIDDEVIEHLRGAQVKLAAEQARYEIAFRNDLATLAEQVRRGRVT